jgi:hypothetical protein
LLSTDLDDLTHSEAKSIIDEVVKVKRRGIKNPTLKVNKHTTASFKDKGDSILGIEVTKQVKKKVPVKTTSYKVDPPTVKKNSGWTIGKSLNTAGAILLIGGALVALRWFFLFMKRNDKEE